jgi:hypothetical protein
MATITKVQARALHATVGTHLDYFRRLRERMQAVGFHHQDPLLLAVREVEDRLGGLWMKLHYLGCEGGVGAPSGNRSTQEPPPAP